METVVILQPSKYKIIRQTLFVSNKFSARGVVKT